MTPTLETLTLPQCLRTTQSPEEADTLHRMGNAMSSDISKLSKTYTNFPRQLGFLPDKSSAFRAHGAFNSYPLSKSDSTKTYHPSHEQRTKEDHPLEEGHRQFLAQEALEQLADTDDVILLDTSGEDVVGPTNPENIIPSDDAKTYSPENSSGKNSPGITTPSPQDHGDVKLGITQRFWNVQIA